MRTILGTLAVAAFSVATLAAQPAATPMATPSADEIVARYVKTLGGMDKIQAIKTVKRSGKYTGGGGFEAKIVEENKRPDMVRQEFMLQGMVGITAYDGKTGWKIEPWQGKKDVESLGEDEMKGILEDADFDGPLVGYKEKGNRVELAGTEPVEGTDAYKLKVTLKNGDVLFYFMDTDFFVPIKIERKRMVRGAERESETVLGDYKEVAGVYFPHSYEIGNKGSANRAKTVFDRIEANVPLDDSLFRPPAPVAAAGK
jgi:outer membrane lipoprotein-sorting protein